MNILVDTPDGQFVRQVLPASALAPDLDKGLAVEHATATAAAHWGMPDFVFGSVLKPKASGVREVGDVIVVHGKRGLLIEAKARSAAPGAAPKEESWARKAINRAQNQIQGTYRTLRTAPVEITNARGHLVTVGGNTTTWIGVILIDHPQTPEIEVILTDTSLPIVVLSRSDWEFLFDQLRSTRGVIDYLARVSDQPHRVGREAVRYYSLAQADAVADPEEPEPSMLEHGGLHYSEAALPLEPMGSLDSVAHDLYRIMMEDVATSPASEDQRPFLLEVLAALDSAPLKFRVDLGETLLSWLESVKVGKPSLRSRTLRSKPGKPMLIFSVSQAYSEERQAQFSNLVALRHHDQQALEGNEHLATVGIMLTPRSDGRRLWDTTMTALQGELGLAPLDIEKLRELYPYQPDNLGKS